MENKNTSLQTVSSQGSFVERMLQSMDSLDKAKEFGEFIIKSGFAPPHFKTPESVVLTVDAGMRIGFTWSQALQEGHIINGIPGYKAKALKALVLGSGVCDKWETSWKGSLADGTLTHVITAHRIGAKVDYVREFGIAEAQRAGLWGKNDVWKKFGEVMLENRNTARVCDFDFADVTKGFKSVEELQDYPTEMITEDGIMISSTKVEKSAAVTDAAKNMNNPKGKGAPATKQKIKEEHKPEEPVQEAVEVKDEKPVVDITAGMDQLDAASLWQRLVDNIDFDPSLLFIGKSRTKGMVRKLLTAIKNNALDEHLKAAYPDFTPAPVTLEEESGKGMEADSGIPDNIEEPEDGGRSFPNSLIVSDYLEEMGANPDKVADKFSDIFTDIDEFYKRATLSQITEAINLK